MAYCTLAEVRRELDIEEVVDDNLLSDLIVRSQAIIDGFTNRTFEASTDTARTFDAVENVTGQTLFLDEDLASLTSVTNGDGNAIATNVIVTLPPNETPYYGLKIRSDQSATWTYTDYSENAISISGKWAFSTSAPADIKSAAIGLTVYLYRRRASHEDLDRPLLTNDGVTILPSNIPHWIRETLTRYVIGVK